MCGWVERRQQCVHAEHHEEAAIGGADLTKHCICRIGGIYGEAQKMRHHKSWKDQASNTHRNSNYPGDDHNYPRIHKILPVYALV